MATATGRHPAPPASPGTSRRRTGIPRPFWVLWTGILINRLGTLVEPFLALYLVAVRGCPVAATGGVLAVYALGSMISQITGGAPQPPRRRAREGNRGTTLHPGRPAHTPTTGSSGKPLPGLPPTLRPPLLPFPRRCHPVRAGGQVKDRAQPGRTAAPAGRP